MKRINEYASSAFLVLGCFGALYFFGGKLLLTTQMSKQRTSSEDPQHVAMKRIEGNEKLGAEQLEDLINIVDLRWTSGTSSVPVPAETSPSEETSDTKKILNILQTERDKRIETERNEGVKTKITFFATVLAGFFVFRLKSKKHGPKLISDEEKREDAITTIELVFGVLIVSLSLIF